MSKIIQLTIDGKEYNVPDDYSILRACEENDIYVPRLCFLDGIHEQGNCRLCSVEVNSQANLKPSCTTKVQQGMNVVTENKKIYDYVSTNLELLASNHHFECFKCSREENCELLDLLRRYSIFNEYSGLYGYELKDTKLNNTSDAIVIDSSKCVLCGRCISTCEKKTGIGVLDFNKRGNETYVGPALFRGLEDSGCIYCGKCIQACPTGAIREQDHIKEFERAVRDSSKTVVVQVAPSIRAALGEEFGYPVGTNVEGKMFAALHQLGVNEIIDTNFTADLTIVEEGSEFLDRVQNDGVLPMFTSCSPGWVNYLELYYPELIPNVSTCKSPQQMAGAVIKTYYAKRMKLDSKDIVSVSIMPCVAKKAEAQREDMGRDGYRDVDIVLTTRELARLIKRRGIDFNSLQPIEPFGDLAIHSGAATIFGATGGVMEAALRTVSELLDSKVQIIDFKEVRGKQNIKEATYHLAGKDINIAVVHGAKAIGEFLEMLKTSKKEYHFVEFMGCVGGCINGGGQPIVKAKDYERIDVIKERSKVLYTIDQKSILRKSHLNPAVQKLYTDFLNKLNHHDLHNLLHTHYEGRVPYSKYIK